MVATGIRQIDFDNLISRSVQIGDGEQPATNRTHNSDLCFKFVDYSLKRSVDLRRHRILELFKKQQVSLVSPLVDLQKQVSPIVRNASAGGKIRIVRPFVDQLVLLYGIAQAMVIHLLISELGEGLIFGTFGLGKFRIEKSFAVFGPAWLRKFNPSDDIRKILVRLDVTNPNDIPIRTAGCNPIGQQPTIITHRGARDRHRSVARELIRIQQNLWRLAQIFLRVNYALIL